MEPGTVVYLKWYDFVLWREDVLQGEVVEVDEDTQSISVRFQPPSLPGTIIYPFPAERLSLSDDPCTIPADPATEVGEAAKRQKPQQVNVRTTVSKPAEDTRSPQAVLKRFMEEHWDKEHNHLQVDYLNEYYELWWAQIASRVDYAETKNEDAVACIQEQQAQQPSVPVCCDSVAASAPSPAKNPTRKQQRSVGRIIYKDTVQTSLFE